MSSDTLAKEFIQASGLHFIETGSAVPLSQRSGQQQPYRSAANHRGQPLFMTAWRALDIYAG